MKYVFQAVGTSIFNIRSGCIIQGAIAGNIVQHKVLVQHRAVMLLLRKLAVLARFADS